MKPNNDVRIDFLEEPDVLTQTTFEFMPPLNLQCVSWKDGDAFIAPGNLLIKRNWPKAWNPLILSMAEFIRREEEEGHRQEPRGIWHYTEEYLSERLANSGLFAESPYKEIINQMSDAAVDLTLCLSIAMVLAGTHDTTA